ncbi:hypothetical protein AAE478_006576 [Parahypoxylon ruwenzoriense]
MAASDASSPNEREILVTLVSRPPGPHFSHFPERQFVLSRKNPSISIGRASKVPTKGFVAATDNAWFDSPVMSRHHAQLVIDCDNTPKAVFIKDIGSLHGTFHTPNDMVGKESRLGAHQPVKLANGDSLRFGIDVFRSKETFPPCSIDFYMIERESQTNHPTLPDASQSTNRVFTVPDDDIDDEDEDDADDSIIMEISTPPSHKAGIWRGPSIDLTRDEFDSADNRNYTSSVTARMNINSDVIDLTSEPDEDLDSKTNADAVHSSHTARSLGRPAFTAPSGSPTSGNRSQNITSIDLEVDQVSDQGEPHIDDGHDEEMSSEDIRLSDSEIESPMTEDSVDDVSDEDDDADEDDSLSSDFIPARSDSWGVDTDQNLYDLPYSDGVGQSSSEKTDAVSSGSSAAPDSPPSLSPIPHASKDPTSENALLEPSDIQHSSCPFVTPSLFSAFAEHGTSIAQPREPSPSDAAMFKSRPTLAQAPSNFRAQALGEVSGKYEYFAARESNRMVLDCLSPPPVSAIRETLAENSGQPVASEALDCAPSSSSPSIRYDSPRIKPAEESIDAANAVPEAPLQSPNPPCADLKTSADSHDSTWSTSGERFINNPRTEDLPWAWSERPQSPEFDMTSAYAFQQSKLAVETNTNQHLRRVGIQDLLTQEPKNSQIDAVDRHLPRISTPPPIQIDMNVYMHGLKRSFEDAFDGGDDSIEKSHDSVRLDGGLASESSDRQARDIASLGEEAIGVADSMVTLPQAEVEVHHVAVPIRATNVQPSKRRRFAQAAACVALGGAAAFTFMVSTAPAL